MDTVLPKIAAGVLSKAPTEKNCSATRAILNCASPAPLRDRHKLTPSTTHQSIRTSTLECRRLSQLGAMKASLAALLSFVAVLQAVQPAAAQFLNASIVVVSQTKTFTPADCNYVA
ncbi:hypothetical protein HaLaN_26026, partial [Haematococcus lacustris]